MAWVLGHRQTKGAATDIPYLPSPRHTSTLPVNQLARRSTSAMRQPTIRCAVSNTPSAALEYSQGESALPMNGNVTQRILAEQPSPRAGAVRARWLLACAA